MADNASRYKIVVVGDGAVGKTTFVKKCVDPESTATTDPTVGAEVYPLDIATSSGDIKFDIWDTVGQEKLSGLRDGYYWGAHAVILMFDVSSRVSYKNVVTWHRDVLRVVGNVPVVLIANKIDVQEPQVQPSLIQFHRKKHVVCYGVSAKLGYNTDRPLLLIARILRNETSLTFTERVENKASLKSADQVRMEEFVEKIGGGHIEDADEEE